MYELTKKLIGHNFLLQLWFVFLFTLGALIIGLNRVNNTLLLEAIQRHCTIKPQMRGISKLARNVEWWSIVIYHNAKEA